MNSIVQCSIIIAEGTLSIMQYYLLNMVFSSYSDYGYARPGTDLTGSCMRDPDVTLTDPCASGNTETYTASTG